MAGLTSGIGRIAAEFKRRMYLVFLLDWIVVFSFLYGVMFVFREVTDLLFDLLPGLGVSWQFVVSFLVSFYVVFRLHRGYSRDVISLVEEVYPQLRERLSTAYDNRRLVNIVVWDLISAVEGELRGVRGGRLLKKNLIISRLLMAAFLLLAVFYVVEEGTSVGPDDIDKALAGVPFIGEEAGGSLDANESIDGEDDSAGSLDEGEGEGDEGSERGGNILGKPTIASIEGKKIDIVLYSGGGVGLQLREASETQQDFTESPRYPVDAEASNVSDSYLRLLEKSELERDLINRYALEQSRGGG